MLNNGTLCLTPYVIPSNARDLFLVDPLSPSTVSLALLGGNSPTTGSDGSEHPGCEFETRDGGKTWRQVEMGGYVNKIRIVPDGSQFTAFAIGADVYKFAVHAGGEKAAGDVAPISVVKP